MITFIVRRLIQAVLVIILVGTMVFFAIRFLPGDPILLYLSRGEQGALNEEQIQAARVKFGLDKPLAVQYISWLSNILHGDFGTSLFYQEKVSKLIAERIPITFNLGLLAFMFSTILGIATGVVSALRRGKFIDTLATTLANIGICIPVFWLGILLIYLFGLRLNWLPLLGYTSPFNDFWLSTRQSILPVFCLMIFSLASIARQTRSSMLEVLRQDYVRTAWSKGLNERIIVIRHILKNSLIPVITLMGISISHILGGSVIIETVFNIPGLGRLSVSALLSQDYAIVQAIVLLIALIVVLANLLVDICYGWLDPRIRYR